jgi:hypothetical protein
VMITEQPGVNIAFAQRRLNGSQIHGQTSIVNKGMSLGEFSRRSRTIWTTQELAALRSVLALQ